ncbi:Unknown protein [Striga hermonthica]|uniref:Uncharacterized protein n=1 Tax=Striga hermonthica TaxID=68872 RepID=A0A9N7N0K0_STRHE|nr:Unknown protein [Striga hermonthica]
MEGGEKMRGISEKVMEGVASLALLPSGSISGHFVQLPHSVCYGLHGVELECERECSRGEDYRLIKLTVTDFSSKKERDIVVECRGHDAAKICSTDHAHGWQKDVVGMVEEKHGKNKVTVFFECETLKSEKAADDHLQKFMPKLVGMDAVVNIGRMAIEGLDFDADTEHERVDEQSSQLNH